MPASPRSASATSLAHELAHVSGIRCPTRALPDTKRSLAAERIEAPVNTLQLVSSCLGLWMKRADLDERIQDVPSLARLFGVSWLAMRVRLEQFGFVVARRGIVEEPA